MSPARARSASTPPYTGTPAPDRRLASSFVRRPRDPGQTARSIGVAGPYAPATSPAARHARLLVEGLAGDDVSVQVVRVGQPAGTPLDAPEVVFDYTAGLDAGETQAARILNRTDLVVIEHEVGGRGDLDTDQNLRLLKHLCVPVAVVVGLLPAAPPAGRQAVLGELVRSADVIVAASEADRQRLHSEYGAALRHVLVIDQTETINRYRELIDALLRRP